MCRGQLLPVFFALSFSLTMAVPAFAQVAPNSLQIERNGAGLRLRYTLSNTNGAVLLVQGNQPANLFGFGQILVFGAATNLTGTMDLPLPTDSAAFFALRQDPNALTNGGVLALPNFVHIPAGTFQMGSPATETERATNGVPNEIPHPVTISHDFYMSKYEVTQREYLTVMGNNPSFFTAGIGYMNGGSRALGFRPVLALGK